MPSALPVIYTRIQDQTDAPSLGAGQDGYVLKWNNATSSFDAVAATGTGDFLADGTVPMTGDFQLAGNEITSTDGDSAHDLGRVTVGYDGTNADFAAFAHRDFMSGTAYAFCQGPTGSSFFNAPTGQAISLRINNVEKVNLSALTLELNALAIDSDDADTLCNLGRASVGYSGFGDDASFGHRDYFTSTGYAVRQNQNGTTFINAASGQTLALRVGNLSTVNIDSSNMDMLANTLASNDADSAHDLGRVTVGYDGTNADRAIFAHRDHATSAAAAFAQLSSGSAEINAPTGQTIQFSINGSDVVRINSSGNLGVGTTSPDRLLHIEDSTVASAPYETNVQAIFERNGDAGIQIVSTATTNSSIFFGDAGDSNAGEVRYDHANDRFVFRVGGADLYAFDSNLLHPNFDNVVDLGHSGARHDDIYATNGTIQTSDANDKKAIADSRLGLDFVNRLHPVSYQWRRGSNPKKQGSDLPDRTHYGLIAQDVKATLDEVGISTDNFAGYIDGGERLGLRYTEFIAPMIRAIQELSARVEALEV